MDIVNIVVNTFTDKGFLSAIASTVLIILLGYFCRKKNIFNNQAAKILSKVVLTVALPALAFSAFMTDLNQKHLAQGINVLIWGILMYIVLIF